VPVSELGVADVGEAVGLGVVPPVPELRLPHEGQRALDLSDKNGFGTGSLT
jgi:hypothetical protein